MEVACYRKHQSSLRWWKKICVTKMKKKKFKKKPLNPTNAQNLEKNKNLVGAKYSTLVNAMLVITSLV